MARDKVKPLMKLIAEGKLDRLAIEGGSALQAIERNIEELREQAGLIRTLLGRYAPHGAAEGLGMPLPVEKAGDGFSSERRSRLVREAALELARDGADILNAQQVVDHLAENGIVFSIKRPGSMVGSVLASMREFHRTEVNRFRYVGRSGAPPVESRAPPIESRAPPIESRAPAIDADEIPFE